MDDDINKTVGEKLGDQLRRGTPLYRTILQSTQWQRDNYLMGNRYADKRKRERRNRPNEQLLVLPPRIKYGRGGYRDALGYSQICNLGISFIPSDTVKKALMPIVLQQPRTSLYNPALRGIVSLIDSQQATVDDLVKNNILNLLEQERTRKLVMNSTTQSLKGERSNI